jgi:hypothetical protein
MLGVMRSEWIGAPDRQQIVPWLTALASRPERSIFTSRHWLAACIASWPADLRWRVWSAHSDEPAFDSLAIIGRGRERRHWILSSRVLALNQSVRPTHDEPFIEMNGFYGGSNETFPETFETLLQELLRDPTWDEFKVPGLLPAEARAVESIASKHRLNFKVIDRKPTYWTDLEKIRRVHSGDVYAALSPNSRQQVRRAYRALEKNVGPVSLARAESVTTALEWLALAGMYHRARWVRNSGTYYGGFDNADFVTFHQTLIREAFSDDIIDFWRICAGDRPFAYLYNFRVDNKAFFYLSGIDYGIGEKYKPGMIAHLQAISNGMACGLSSYDFLAGENRYKASLCTDQSEQIWLNLQRPRIKLHLERIARDVKKRIQASRAAKSVSAPPSFRKANSVR